MSFWGFIAGNPCREESIPPIGLTSRNSETTLHTSLNMVWLFVVLKYDGYRNQLLS